ncbi:MAG: hypothetical protein NZ524_06795 [Thiobacillaceae bacterium]|nr:hypothetical protein [Thiobacillaceae bacterium]MDW8324198.1 hypothetical protein [Burkholderiales bacterium]
MAIVVACLPLLGVTLYAFRGQAATTALLDLPLSTLLLLTLALLPPVWVLGRSLCTARPTTDIPLP